MPDEIQTTLFRCPGCGEFLPSGRVTLRFHGSACRARFWRRKRDIGLHTAMIQQYLADMQSVVESGVCRDEIVEYVEDIRNALYGLDTAIQESYVGQRPVTS